jgi:large repetitive protein
VPPSLSISDVSRFEGNSGTVAFAFTVTLSKASRAPVRVAFATADGTASAAGGDYHVFSGRVKFDPGQVSRTVVVEVRGDELPEEDETFFVNLSRAENAVIADAQGVGTIRNDDPPPPQEVPDPTISIGQSWLPEGDALTRWVNVLASLSAPSTKSISVAYATADGTALVGDNDYPPASGTLTFAPGETAKELILLSYGDTAVEPDEIFFVRLSQAINAVIADGEGTVTIANDDGLPPPPDDGGGGGGGDCTPDHAYYPNC